MSVATFVAKIHPTPAPEDLIVYQCVSCDPVVEVLAMESDSHASRVHRAQIIRVFGSPAMYKDFLREEKMRVSLKEGI